MLLLENVKGLLNHDGGRTFTVIVQALDELGYWVEWQVLNSKHFGVPQNRERVFIIGHLRGTSGREVFPITETNGTINQYIREERGLEPYIQNIPHGYNTGFKKTLPSLKSNSGAQYNELLVLPILTPDRQEKRQHGRRFKDNGEPMFTLTGQDKHGVMIYNIQSSGRGNGKIEHRIREGISQIGTGSGGNTRQEKTVVKEDLRIRRLTPIECERLQGFPDNWTNGISDNQRQKCLGNAVTVNVIEYLGKQIRTKLSLCAEEKE